MRHGSLFLIVAAVAIGTAVLSFQRTSTNIGEESAPSAETIAAHPPLKQNFNAPTVAKAEVEITAGPQGTFSAFQRLASETLETLPTVEDIRKKTHGEVHFTPPELMEAAPSLGKVATAIQSNAELIPQGIEFYHECARREGALTAVRVLCLRNLRFWAKEQPDIMQVRPSDYPESLWELADSLPPVVR